MKHSNIPFEIDINHKGCVFDADGNEVCECADEVSFMLSDVSQKDCENAAFIVAACNNHYDLMDALEDAIEIGKAFGLPMPNAIKALKKAKGL